jgi:hypothetical protein
VPTTRVRFGRGFLGAFFSSKLALSEFPDTVLDEIDQWLEVFETHLRDAGVGQISEIFDGN